MTRRNTWVPAPEILEQLEVARAYNRGARVAMKVTDLVRAQGRRTRAA